MKNIDYDDDEPQSETLLLDRYAILGAVLVGVAIGLLCRVYQAILEWIF